MGSRFPSVVTTAPVNPLPANATETVFFTTPQITLPFDSTIVWVFTSLFILAGTGVTALVFHIRRGTLITSQDISGGGFTHTLAAGNNAAINVSIPDLAPGPSAPVYSLTIIQTGATAASTVNVGWLGAVAF